MIASKDRNNPLEAKYWYLLITHFHNELQEVKCKVDEYSNENVKSRGKQPLEIAAVFSPN